MDGEPSRRGRPRHPDILTPAEWAVVDAVRHGLSNRQIAARRGVSLDAVKFHVANAVGKLGLTGRRELRTWPGVPYDSALRQATTEGAGAAMETQLGPIGQISRQVGDVEAAVRWYGEVLGLTHLFTFGPLTFFDCGGTRLFLSQVAPGETPGPESLVYFRVPDIHAAHAELTGRGVRFEGAPHLIHRHESGVEEWMAFFNDPEGRPLAIMAQTGG